MKKIKRHMSTVEAQFGFPCFVYATSEDNRFIKPISSMVLSTLLVCFSAEWAPWLIPLIMDEVQYRLSKI